VAFFGVVGGVALGVIAGRAEVRADDIGAITRCCCVAAMRRTHVGPIICDGAEVQK
jgi:hypothetical protein